MHLSPLPRAASWTHRGARAGFEVVFFSVDGALSRARLHGRTTANEGGSLWSVGYEVELYGAWCTRFVRASSLARGRERQVVLERSDDGWIVGGQRRPDLEGCVDVDFESSAVTNTLPIHRIDFVVGVPVDVPAAFVRADDLRVERMEQQYTLTALTDAGPLFHYESSTFDFSADLRFDTSGLVLEYPGIAVRDS